MKVKMILPALTEAKSPFWRPIKYSLFPPLGLATLAAYLDESDEITLQDEHVEALELDDEPDLVVIQVYITSAYRAYQIADHYRVKGAYICLGGLHVTSLPEEAQRHADTIFIGPGEDTWPAFLHDFRGKSPQKKYVSEIRTLVDLPFPRRDLLKRHLYLVPNSLVVSRGCPHVCDFCYKEAFFEGGKSFYTLNVDRALAEIVAVTKPGGRIIVSTPNYLSAQGLNRLVLWLLRRPYSEMGQPVNNVMIGAARPWKLRRLGCRVDAMEGDVFFWQILGTDRRLSLRFLRRFKRLGLHTLVVATRRP